MHFSRITVKYIHTRTSSASREITVQMKSRMKRVAGGVHRHIFPLFPVFNRRKWHSTSVSPVFNDLVSYFSTITRRTKDRRVRLSENSVTETILLCIVNSSCALNTFFINAALFASLLGERNYICRIYFYL